MSAEIGREAPAFDVVGMGLNAADHICVVPRFPKYEEKLRMTAFKRAPGGQVASALTACAVWGLRAKYIGRVGDDDLGAFSLASLVEAGIDTSEVRVVKGVANQFAFILVDASTGERTIIWRRDPLLEIAPDEVPLEAVRACRFLLLDGHDSVAAAVAAREASRAGVSVVVDAETVKAGTADLVKASRFVVSSREFPERFTGKSDLDEALREILAMGPECVVATLGKEGATALDRQGPTHSRGFRVEAVDSTGAGDVFHGAFIYGLAQGWPIRRVLDFSNAAAALNCTELGARGGIKPVAEILDLIERGSRW
ncbi:MAG: PfkB family carbohydrate kinase [bacterium]